MTRLFRWLAVYESKAKKLRITVEVERAFETEILKNPEKGALLRRTGGIRKVRVGEEGRGKSGSYRFFYLDLPHVERTYVMYVIAKGEQENISRDEEKLLKALVERIKQEVK